MMGGWKQKSGWIQIPPASCVPFTFPFLSQLSVCLIVSRGRAYLTTDQQCALFIVSVDYRSFKSLYGLRTRTKISDNQGHLFWPIGL